MNQNLNNWYSIPKQTNKTRVAKRFLSLPSLEEKLDYSNDIELLTNEFVDEAKVYTSITNINIDDSRLIITFGNGLTFDCGIVKGEKISLRKTILGIEYKYESETDEQYKLLVPINDILYKFENLTDEQKDQLKFHFSDFTEAEIKLLQQPALDMIDVANGVIKEAKEQIKNISALSANTELLNQKITEAEEIRDSQEEIRKSNDEDRERRTNSAIGDINNAKKLTEAVTENAKAAADKANTEANRAKLLADHPSKIVDKIWYVFEESVNDYVNTNIIAEGKNGKSPIIKDGIWWKYNDELGDYESTNMSVNSDYELTKGKVEAVFNGDISSHNHDSMYYTEAEVDDLLAAVQPKINVVDNLVSNSTTEPLSANQGKILNESKVDKVTGKGLSTEDYTTADKKKLASIAHGAEVNVNADWNATEGDSQILNKPTIPSKTSEIIKDDVYTKSEIDTSLNLKVDKTLVGTSNGLAQLDETGKVPAAQLPFLPDDLLSLGETADKAYPGDKGKKNADDIDKIKSNFNNYSTTLQIAEIYATKSEIPTPIAIDSELSLKSENPVQNKILSEAIYNTKEVFVSEGVEPTGNEKIWIDTTENINSDLNIITDAPNDTFPYVRKNKSWCKSAITDDVPTDGKIYGRKDGSWSEITNNNENILDLSELLSLEIANDNLLMKLENAVNSNINTFIVDNDVLSGAISSTNDEYILQLTMYDVPENDKITELALNIRINKSNKKITLQRAGNLIISNGDGTKAKFDDNNYYQVTKEAPSDGKIYGRKDKAWVEVNVDQIAYLPIDLLSLEPGVATSDEIKQALGGDDAFKKLLEDIASGKTLAISIPGEATITLGTCMVKFADEQDPSQSLMFNYAGAGIALTVATTSVYNGTYSFELNSAGDSLIVENEHNLDQGFYVVHKASGSNYLSKIFKIPTIILPVEFLNLNSNSTNEEIASIFNTQVEVNNGYSSYNITLFEMFQSHLEQIYYSFIPIIKTSQYYPYRPIPVKYIYESGYDSIVIEYAQNGVNHKVVVTLKSSVYSIVKESHSQYPIISTLAPTSADGNDGDIWIQYSN